MRLAFFLFLAASSYGESVLDPGAENGNDRSSWWSFPLRATATGLTALSSSLFRYTVNYPYDINNAQLKGQGSGRCLDVLDGATDDDSPLGIYDCTGHQNQNWNFKFIGSSITVGGETHPIFNIVSSSSGKCLTVKYGGTGNGNTVNQFKCGGAAGSPNQQWYRRWPGKSVDYFNLVGTQSNKCLTVHGMETGNSAGVVIYDCNEESNEMWTLV